MGNASLATCGFGFLSGARGAAGLVMALFLAGRMAGAAEEEPGKVPGTRLQVAGEDLPVTSSPTRRVVPLSGEWELRAEPRPGPELKKDAWLRPIFAHPVPATTETIPVRVPGVWQSQGLGMDYHTRAVYRKHFEAPGVTGDRAVWLRLAQVATRAEVRVNGVKVGEHLGAWTAFEFDVTPYLRKENVLEVRVDEEPEHYTAGFIRHVGVSFGGIWGDVWLEVRPRAFVQDAFFHLPGGGDEGEARVEIGGEGMARDVASVELTVTGADGSQGPVVRQAMAGDGGASGPVVLRFPAAELERWSFERPAMHRAKVRLLATDGTVVDEQEKRFGLRSFGLKDGKLMLNGRPLYWAGILHWAAYPDYLVPGCTREEFRREIRELKRLGFNAVNVCLFLFPERFYEVADEEGMLLWQEYPLWLYFPGSIRPTTTEAKEQLTAEYVEMFRRVRTHPSVLLHSLAVEDPEGDLELMRHLYDLCHEVIPGSVVQDNSAFLNQKIADFMDHHPYEELEGYGDQMTSWVQAVERHGDGPLLFGEALDFDTLRDCGAVLEAFRERPWWTLKEYCRTLIIPADGNDFWEHDIRQKALKEELGAEGFAEIGRNAREHAWAARKYQIEQSRLFERFGGMALTALRDIVCTRPGIFDDLGQLKWSEEEVRRFNAPTLPLLDTDRQSRSYWSGETAQLRFSVNHFGADALTDAVLECAVVRRGGKGEGANGTTERRIFEVGEVRPGTVRASGVWELKVPAVAEAEAVQVSARLLGRAGDAGTVAVIAENEWKMWVFPEVTPADGKASESRVHDPRGRLMKPGLSGLRIPEGVLVASVLDDRVTSHLQSGGAAVVVDPRGRALPAHDTPFWREVAVERFDRGMFQGFPWTGAVDLPFYGLGSKRAYDVHAGGELRPLLRTINCRYLWQNELIVETESKGGRLIATTLNLPGKENPAGLDLLQRLVDRAGEQRAGYRVQGTGE